ncbi:MAG: anti-sigma factor [Pseudomonadota bacterium]
MTTLLLGSRISLERSLGLAAAPGAKVADQVEPDNVELALAELGHFTVPLEPPGDLLARIEQDLDQDQAHRIATTWRRARRSFWHGTLLGAGTGSLAAAGLAAALLVDPAGPAPSATKDAAPVAAIAALGATSGPGQILIELAAPDRYLVIDVDSISVVEDGSLELWLIADETTPPRSLGLLAAHGPRTVLPLSVFQQAAFLSGATLAVSQEPAGGSPQAGPTGPVLFVGAHPVDQ